MQMANRGGPSVLDGAHHLTVDSIEVDSKAAGRDIASYSPTVNINITGGASILAQSNASAISPSASSTLGASQVPLECLTPVACHACGTTQATVSDDKCGLFGRVSRLFPRVKKSKPKSGRNRATQLENQGSSANPSQTRIETEGKLGNLPSSSSPAVLEDTIKVCSMLESPELFALSPDELTYPEVYVRSLLTSGKGLACWMPQPLRTSFVGEGGVIPGDVGTYTAEGGFKKSFNLWDDQTSLGTTAQLLNEAEYRPPPRNVARDSMVLREGDTVVEGAEASAFEGTVNGQSCVSSFEFCCQSPQGAMLALTSSADLEQTGDILALRDCIVRNAPLFYKHANSIWKVGQDESLYIVTGCIKSDSWAIAAYRRPMEHPRDIIRLVRAPSDATNPEPVYKWTNRGTSEARSQDRIGGGLKCHSLFLRGFKLSFSQEAHFQMKQVTRPSMMSPDPNDKPFGGNDSSAHRDQRGGRGPESERRGPEGGGSRMGGSNSQCLGGSSSTSQALDLGTVQLDMFPKDRSETGAPFALSHDDDWRGLARHPGWNVCPSHIIKAVTKSQSSTVRNGVAYLAGSSPPLHPIGANELRTKRHPFMNRKVPGPVTKTLDANSPWLKADIASTSGQSRLQLTVPTGYQRGTTSLVTMNASMGFIPSPSDPFFEFMQPPANETPAQATARQARERDAKRVNDKIDDMLKKERAQTKKAGCYAVKVLLLGQSESGKSTALKNFRMRFAKEEWEQERNGWRTVVQLNIVRSITTIIRVLEAEMNGAPHFDDSDDQQSITAVESNQSDTLKFTEKHQLLMVHLAPVLSLEGELKRHLGAETEPVLLTSMVATPFDTPQQHPSGRKRLVEFSVRSWKDVIEAGRTSALLDVRSASCDEDLPTTVMAQCKDDMKALWQDKTVQRALNRRKLVLADSAGFFLNDLDRIATRDYIVTDNDIVRARLRTVGIQEHRLHFKNEGDPLDHARRALSVREWRMFDVGGCRTLRSAWLPYFEGVNAIIFLSPLSVFDQSLEEDPRVNRLQDSMQLWTAICSSKLLARTQLILFLNKCDLLEGKLKRGVKVTQYVLSYGDRPNNVMPVIKYFKEKFKSIQRNCSPEHRTVYIYPTTMTDTEATGLTLEAVWDGVLREQMAASELL